MFGMIISATASLSLFVLSLYIILKKRASSNITLFIATAVLALIEFSDQYALYHATNPLLWKNISIFLESLLPVTFLFFSLVYARETIIKSISPIWWIIMALAVLFPASVLFFPINEFIYSPDLQTEKILFLGEPGYWFYMGLMIYCVLALINLETTFSSTSGSIRWRMKFEVIGIACLLSVLIFYFSQGLLYRIINMNLMIIRSGIFTIGALLIAYSKIFRGNDIRVSVSRYIVYRSFTLLIVGLYLVGLGLIGEGMRYLDIPFSRDLTAFLAFAFGILLFIVLLSENVRRRAKVFINKHFYKHKHDYREAWLKFTAKLSTCKTLNDVHAAVLTTYIEAFGLAGASLYLFDKGKNRYMLTSHTSMPYAPTDFQVSAELISYFLDRDRILNAHDDEYSPTVEESSLIRQMEAQLIVPLVFNKKVAGLVAFKKQLVNEEFTYEDYDLMKTLAKQAAQSIVTFTLSEELIESKEMTAVAKVSSFVMHDIKNLTYSLSLILDNAENFMNNPEFQSDMLETLRNTVSKMKNLIQKLKTIPEKHALNTELTDINLLAREVVADIMKMGPIADIVCHGSPAFSSADGEEIKKVILNLAVNALDAVGEKGIVTFETTIDGQTVCLKVRDNGCGIAEDFIKNHMFKPFRTTKEKGLGIGLYQCRQIIEAHGGTIGVESVLGQGTIFTVLLPAAACTDYAMHEI